MYCPRCAALNVDDAKFCRACGADIHLVPQALNGSLPEAINVEEGGRRHRRGVRYGRDGERRPSLSKGFENLFMGLAFLIIFLGGLIFFRRGFMMWVWFIIPAMGLIGSGIGQIMSARREEARSMELRPSAPATSAVPLASTPRELPPRETAEMLTPPPSITEGTTRHLGVPVETRKRKDALPDA